MISPFLIFSRDNGRFCSTIWHRVPAPGTVSKRGDDPSARERLGCRGRARLVASPRHRHFHRYNARKPRPSSNRYRRIPPLHPAGPFLSSGFADFALDSGAVVWNRAKPSIDARSIHPCSRVFPRPAPLRPGNGSTPGLVERANPIEEEEVNPGFASHRRINGNSDGKPRRFRAPRRGREIAIGCNFPRQCNT